MTNPGTDDQFPGEIITPKPGIYGGIGFEAYRAWDGAMNYSTLMWGLTTAKHMKASLDGLLKRDSDAMRFGRALHCRILEPDIFEQAYTTAAACQAILKSGSRKGAPCGNASGWREPDGQWRCGVHCSDSADEPTNILSTEERMNIEAVTAAVKSHEIVKLISQHGGAEESAIFDCEGIRTKVRFDKLILNQPTCPNTILDFKKVRVGKGGDDAWSKAVLKYRYDVQAAIYVDAVAALAGVDCNLIWIIVEDRAPWDLNVLQCDKDTLSVGRATYKKLAAIYWAGQQSGLWPGYTFDYQKQKNVIRFGGLPEHFKRRMLA